MHNSFRQSVLDHHMRRNAEVSRRRRRQVTRLLWIAAIIVACLGPSLFLLWQSGTRLKSEPESLDAPADATEFTQLPAP
jgi:hypothetical protein